MTSQMDHELVLYDLSCTKNVCFSPVVWRIRMMLNYKRIPYKTIFLEFQDIGPTLRALGLEPLPENAPWYTVPALHHLSTNTYMIGSKPIAEFIEATYPDRVVTLESQLGDRIFANARALAGGPLSMSSMAREPNILTPQAQKFFRETREISFNRATAIVADPAKEEQAWADANDDFQALGDLLRTNHAKGPYILGAQPSYADFFIVGNLQFARVVDEGVFNRTMKFDGFKAVYEACLPFMDRKD